MVVPWNIQLSNLSIWFGRIRDADISFRILWELAVVGAMDNMDASGCNYMVEDVAEDEDSNHC